MPTKYTMRAFKTSAPTGFVFWTVQDSPDLTGSLSPYSPSVLQNIIVNSTFEAKTPTTGVQFSTLIESPAGSASFQPITADMIAAAFTVSVSGGIAVETSRTIVNPTFTASYSGGTPVSGGLSNNFDGYIVTASSPYTSFPTTHSYVRNTPGQSITFNVTANNGTINKTGTSTYTWLQPAYNGVGAPGQTSAGFITGLINKPLTSARATSFTVNPSGQKIYYAHRTAYGVAAPTNFSVGGFAGGFTNTATVSVTGAFGFTETYYLYESDNLLTGSTVVVVS